MTRTLFLSILVFALLLVGLATFNNGVIALSIPLVLYLAGGILFGPREVNLEINRRIIPERAAPNSPIEVHLSITNIGPKLEEILIQDRLPPDLIVSLGESSILTEFRQGESKTIHYSVEGKRGIYYFEGAQCTAVDRFGIFRRLKFVQAQGSLFIMPDVPKIKRVDIRPRQTRVYSGNVPARLGGPGVEFFGVREYHWGDAEKRINWRATARYTDRVFSNEFEQERVADVGLILDARKRCDIQTPHGTLFEHLITASAALTETLIRDGNRVGLLVYGGFLDWTFPRYGKIQRERIFQALARAQTGDSLVFDRLENLPTKMFPARSQIILLSPLQDDDVSILVKFRACGYQVMVISPDPIAFQVDSLPKSYSLELSERLARIERKLLLNKLRNAGIIVLDWDVRIPFDQALNVALRRIPMWSHPYGARL